MIIDVENGLPYFSPLWRRRPSVCLVLSRPYRSVASGFPARVATVCQAVEAASCPPSTAIESSSPSPHSTAQRSSGDRSGPRSHPGDRAWHRPPDDLCLRSPRSPCFVSSTGWYPHKQSGPLARGLEDRLREIPGRLVIAGDGPELPEIRTGLLNTPSRSHGPSLRGGEAPSLGSSWAVVSAAHHEGWGMSMMEGAAMGTPALATDAPGVRDAVIDGVTGVLVHAPETKCPPRWHVHGWRWPRMESGEERWGRPPENARPSSVGIVPSTAGEAAPGGRRRVRKSGRRTRPPERSMPRSASSRTRLQIHRGLRHAPRMRTSGDTFVGGLRRSLELFKGFRTQYEDPDGFYTMLADDTVELVGRVPPGRGPAVVDVGGGPGYFAQAFRRAGAKSVFVEPFWESDDVVGPAVGLRGHRGWAQLALCRRRIRHQPFVQRDRARGATPRPSFDEMLTGGAPRRTDVPGLHQLVFAFRRPRNVPLALPGRGAGRQALREKAAATLPRTVLARACFASTSPTYSNGQKALKQADLIDAFPRYYPSWTKGVVADSGSSGDRHMESRRCVAASLTFSLSARWRCERVRPP